MDSSAGDQVGENSELKFCCRQLMTKGLDPGHVKCNGTQMEWVVGALIMEMEVCPVSGCGTHFANPLLNLAHQDSCHHCITVKLCGVCRGAYVSEGAFIRYVVRGHGTVRFDWELNQVY